MAKINKLRVFFIIISLIGFSSISIAQYTGGFRVGVNAANMSGSSVTNAEMLIGYNVGAMFNYSLADVISSDFGEIMSVQAEFTIQQNGTTADYKFSDTTLTEIKVAATYVKIPILAKFTFGDEDGMQYFGEAGFYGAALFGLKIDGEVSRDHDDNANTDPRKYREEYTGFDAGVIVGGGLSIPIGDGPLRAYIDARYSLGLMNIGEKKAGTDIDPGQLEDVKNNAISFLAGVTYSF